MEWEAYKFEKTDDLLYRFVSDGPMGRIKKIIRFRHLRNLGPNVYNLGFGDLNEENGAFDDRARSNNGDQLKVLHTVASVVLEFLTTRPRAFVVIKGSTSSRTRLYQMRIAGFLSQVTHLVEVMGEYGKDWQPFQRNVNYERILIYRKNK